MAVSTLLLPVLDKPTIHCPLGVVMLGGFCDIAVFSTPDDQVQFIRLHLLERFRARGRLRVERMGRVYARLDNCTHDCFLDAETGQGLEVGSPDEIA